MKFSLPAKTLSDAISAVGKIVESRNTIPILSNMVVRAAGNEITLQATDLDIEMSLTIEAAVTSPGETTIPARLAGDIIKKCSGNIDLSTDDDGNNATVASGRSRFRLLTLPTADYPGLSAGAFSHEFTMTGKELHRLLSRVEFAVSTEETRYYLNGIYLHTIDVGGKLKLRAVATDGHRLARGEMDAPNGAEGMPAVIVPRKTCKEIISLANAAGGNEIKVELSDTKIRVTAGSTFITSKLIDGTFPDYQRVIPAKSNIVATADSKTLSTSADRVSTISSERGRAVKLTFEPGTLHLATNNPDSGSANDQIDIEYEADAVDVGFNSRYLAEALGHIGPGKVKIYLQDAGSPVILTEDAVGDDYLIVLMPMRV